MNIQGTVELSSDYLSTVDDSRNKDYSGKYSLSMSRTYKTIKEKLSLGKVITFFKNFVVIDGQTYNGVTKEGVVKYCK